MSECEKSVDECIFLAPRNDWERRELQLIKALRVFVYKDRRGNDALCDLISFYRKTNMKRRLEELELGREG